MAVLAITGDIGAGKSTASRLLAEKLNCELLNADQTAKNLWSRNDVKAQAIKRWGRKILDASGKIITAEISSIIFMDNSEHQFCNELIHPLVMSELKARAANFESVVIEVPLLFEARRPEWINLIVYVTAGFDVRAERCREFRGWSIEELRRRERFLLPQSEKIKRSDYVVSNEGSLSELERQIDELWVLIKT